MRKHLSGAAMAAILALSFGNAFAGNPWTVVSTNTDLGLPDANSGFTQSGDPTVVDSTATVDGSGSTMMTKTVTDTLTTPITKTTRNGNTVDATADGTSTTTCVHQSELVQVDLRGFHLELSKEDVSNLNLIGLGDHPSCPGLPLLLANRLAATGSAGVRA